MRKLLAGCLALCIPALLTAQTPADSISRTEAIDSVVVTARRPLMVYKQTGNIAVDIEQLKYAPLFAGEKDIFKFLQLLPGVSAGKDGMSGLLVRGGSNDQTLILYDDVPIYNQAHAYGILSIFSGETVQSAEVSKGYISPAYGSRLSAMTQIRTREGDRRNHRQSLTVALAPADPAMPMAAPKLVFFATTVRSVYKELHTNHGTGLLTTNKG